MAGIIGAKDNEEGVVRVAPGANLWAVRAASGIGQGSTATALCGVDFVTSTRTDGDAANDIAVANMSLGFFGAHIGDDGNCGLTNHDALHLAICNSVAAGVSWVVSAGNSGGDFQDQVPASYSEVLSVTAMADFNGQPGGGASRPAGPTPTMHSPASAASRHSLPTRHTRLPRPDAASSRPLRRIR